MAVLALAGAVGRAAFDSAVVPTLAVWRWGSQLLSLGSLIPSSVQSGSGPLESPGFIFLMLFFNYSLHSVLF